MLTAAGCKPFTIANIGCAAPTGPSCLVCKEGQYFDKAAKKCTAVTAAVDNCGYYNSDMSCARCSPAFYFDPFSKTCKDVPAAASCACFAGTSYRWASTA